MISQHGRLNSAGMQCAIALLRATQSVRLCAEETAHYYPHAKLRPVDLNTVDLTGGFWGQIRTRSRDVGVPTLLEQFEKHGHIENFRICASQAETKHVGGPNCNEFLYKQLEAMGWYAAESPAIGTLHRETAKTILAAQQADGYLNTFYENALNKQRGRRRFQPMNRFEFYNFGHFTQAAIAHDRTTGDRTLLDAAIKFADLIVDQFADPKDLPYKIYRGSVNQKYEHPDHELAMIELYRVTGDKRYLDFVTQTYTEYGYFTGEHFNEMWGHAVQENLLEAGAVDLYLETGDRRTWEVVSRLWNDMHDRKMYIIGGTGSTSHGEAYGEPFELPNASAYAETCAAIALTFWHHKMLLATGSGKFADEMDRTLFNNVLAGYGLNGTTYFYQNPLDWDPINRRRSGRRFEWHGCPCCPPNLHRLLASLGQYIYTHDESGIQVNLFANSTLTHTLPDRQTLLLTQQSNYPWSGRVTLTMHVGRRETTKTSPLPPKPLPPSTTNTEKPIAGNGLGERVRVRGQASTLSLRIPQWCHKPSIRINGKPIDGRTQSGYLVLDQPWSLGKTLELNLPMQPRVIPGDLRIDDQIDRITIQRGPIVYCLEQPDNPGVNLDQVYFPGTPRIIEQFEPDLLNGIVRLTVSAKQLQPDGKAIDTQVKLIPYYAWANREPGRMLVWLPTSPEQLPKPKLPTIASTSQVSASFQNSGQSGLWLRALIDQIEPKHSADKSNAIFHWWPHKGTTEWVQLDFVGPTRVSSVEVYWLDDTGRGQCRVPQSWRLLYRKGQEWFAVEHASDYSTSKDRFVTTTFDPLTTDALRIEAQLESGYSAGILEWRVLTDNGQTNERASEL